MLFSILFSEMGGGVFRAFFYPLPPPRTFLFGKQQHSRWCVRTSLLFVASRNNGVSIEIEQCDDGWIYLFFSFIFNKGPWREWSAKYWSEWPSDLHFVNLTVAELQQGSTRENHRKISSQILSSDEKHWNLRIVHLYRVALSSKSPWKHSKGCVLFKKNIK